MMSGDVDEITLLALSAHSVRTRLLRKLVEQASARGMSLSDVLHDAARGELNTPGAKDAARQVLDELGSPSSAHFAAWQKLRTMGARLCHFASECYPDRVRRCLGSAAPPLLHLLGDPAVADLPSIAIVGSRDASDDALRLTRSLAAAVSQSRTVISGYAKGVDTEAHLGALSAGGTTTVVLSYGLFHYRTKMAMRDFPPDRMLIITAFPPNMPWRAHAAMSRNDLVVALADVVVVIRAHEKGGTVDAARKALQHKVPLVVVDWASSNTQHDGNRDLLREGAIPAPATADGIIKAVGSLPAQRQQQLPL
jgi:DNA processing protein